MNKIRVGNVKGPPGPAGPQGEPGDLSTVGGIEEIATVLEERLNDIPDLTLIFENQLI